jgi:AcrR family transcriptional regulator
MRPGNWPADQKTWAGKWSLLWPNPYTYRYGRRNDIGEEERQAQGQAAARTNKAQLYGYFGSKDGLFDAVIADLADRLMSAVPLDAADLPGWAVGMYDENLRHPELVRLMTWLRLERRPVGRLSDRPDDGPKLAAIARAQAAGHLRAGDPADLMGLVIAMACAWSPVSSFYAATAGEPAADHDRRRALLHDCVARAVAP